ncbi:MAG: flagellar FlbD family protein [Pedobacter sp.]
MIFLTRMDKQQMYLNPDHIVSIEETPDTVITLFNGNHFIVKERAGIIISRIVAYRAKIIRRSNGRYRKKYFERQKTSQFRSSTLNRDIICPENCSAHERSPLHSREF